MHFKQRKKIDHSSTCSFGTNSMKSSFRRLRALFFSTTGDAVDFDVIVRNIAWNVKLIESIVCGLFYLFVPFSLRYNISNETGIFFAVDLIGWVRVCVQRCCFNHIASNIISGLPELYQSCYYLESCELVCSAHDNSRSWFRVASFNEHLFCFLWLIFTFFCLQTINDCVQVWLWKGRYFIVSILSWWGALDCSVFCQFEVWQYCNESSLFFLNSLHCCLMSDMLARCISLFDLTLLEVL